MTVVGRALGVVVLVVALAGCNVSNLQFHNDNRLHFTTPASRAKVTTPFTVSWAMSDFTATGLDGSDDSHRGEFVVFVDRAPMPAGKSLRWLARNDDGCLSTQGCPGKAYLAHRGIYLTSIDSVRIPFLPPVDGAGEEQHYVNVVLVDGQGVRIGESAWYRSFQTARRSS